MIEFIGEPGGIRTRDLLIKSQMLYRLSYRLPQPADNRDRPELGQSVARPGKVAATFHIEPGC